MKRAHLGLLLVSLVSLVSLGACKSAPDYGRALPANADALIPLAPGEEPPDFSLDREDSERLLEALDRSLAWMHRPHARRFFPQAGITHARALASLGRFRELLLAASSPAALRAAIAEEFQVFRSAGWDGRGGGVLFTAYCTPVVSGRLERDALHTHPLYALPPDLVKAADGSVIGWDTALGRLERYPSRGAIEAGALLAGKGLELVWLRDPIDAYVTHVNGSAVVRLPDGELLRLGYAGKNGRPYRSLGRELIADGKLAEGAAGLEQIRAWAAQAPPEEVHEYLARNESYVFFTPIDGNPHGSLDVEVTAGRSIATDKTLFPRAALVFVTAQPGELTDAPVDRFYLDQDTGGAIRTAGRADLYLGIGDDAEAVAGSTKFEGQMYYLFLREGGLD